MKGYKCFYNVNTKKFECENVPSEVGNYTPDGTTFWIDSYKDALVTTDNYNKYNLNEVFICKNCNQPFFLDKKEQECFDVAKRELEHTINNTHSVCEDDDLKRFRMFSKRTRKAILVLIMENLAWEISEGK